jgi:hypothetical protein
VPTSKRPQINNVQYLRIPSRILKGVSHEEVVNDEAWQSDVNLECMECRYTQISYIAARVWQSHPRHADLKKVSNRKRPSTQKYLAGPLDAHPMGRPSFPMLNPIKVFRAGEGDDEAEGRSNDLTRTTTKLKEGLAT